MFKEASEYEYINDKDDEDFVDKLIVIVNNDKQMELKGKLRLIDEQERCEIVQAIKYVNSAVLSIDTDRSVCRTLEEVVEKEKKEHEIQYFIQHKRQGLGQFKVFFMNGGDRNQGNIPEIEVCKRLGIEMVDNVGGGKLNSSSKIINNLIQNYATTNRKTNS
jgi:D-beta-D-heptose 7-phosphate kinase/D-beta-D-heptose 1-phosphate adenosyltransferase